MTKKTLEETCEALLDEISLLVGMDGEKAGTAEQARLLESWQVGRMILAVEETQGLEDSERQRLLRMVQTALGKKDTKRFGRRNVYYMRQFAEEYPRPMGTEALCWSHFRILLTVEDSKLRKALEKRAVTGGLSVRQLDEVVAGAVGFKEVDAEKLERCLGISERWLRMYKVVKSADGRGMLDAGFGVLLDAAQGDLAGLKSGTHVQWGKGGRYEVIPAGRRYRYAYEAVVNKVVDGDTLLLEVVLGENSLVRIRFRLRGVNAMEAGTPLGDKATRFLKRRLKFGMHVLVHTHGVDMYGRYVVDVFYESKKALMHHGEKLPFGLGRRVFLNREMVAEKVVQLRK